jgi:hypothetical protein
MTFSFKSKGEIDVKKKGLFENCVMLLAFVKEITFYSLVKVNS